MRSIFFLTAIAMMVGCNNSTPNIEQSKKEALEFVDAFVDTWATQEDYDGLSNYFSENFYTISPGDSFRLEGREKNIAGYKAFLESTDILTYDLYGKNVQVFNSGKSAIVSLYYKMQMKVGQDTVNTAGRDMLVLVKEKDKWEIVADYFSNFPKR